MHIFINVQCSMFNVQCSLDLLQNTCFDSPNPLIEGYSAFYNFAIIVYDYLLY